MLDCPNCKLETSKLIGCLKLNKVVCPNCHENCQGRSNFNYQLHQKEQGVSKGKAWEIDNRIVSKDDNKTIVNRVTGKPAQY